MKLALTHWLPAAVWLGVILALSSVPAQSLPSGGGGPIWSFVLRYSLAHIVEYAVLAALLFRLLASYQAFSGWPAAALAFALTVCFGAFDELYQSFIDGRHSMIADLGLDALGALLGLLIWFCGTRLLRYDTPGAPGR